MKRLLVIVTALLVAVTVPASAQTPRTGSDAGVTRVMQQLQQVTAQRDQATAESAKLKQENDALKAQLKTLGSERDALRRQKGTEDAAVSAQRAQKESADAAALEKLRGQTQELLDRYKETVQTLKEVETDRTGKVRQLTEREQDLKTCVDRNAKLYALNSELLGKFEDHGFWTAMARSEPFTRLKRTELENLADGYRDTARDLVLPAATQKP